MHSMFSATVGLFVVGQFSTRRNGLALTLMDHICDRICKKRSYSLSNRMHLTVHCETCDYGTDLKFGHLTLLTWFCTWKQFYINWLNTLWVATNWSWKLRKAIRPLSQIQSHIILCWNSWALALHRPGWCHVYPWPACRLLIPCGHSKIFK